MPKSRHVVISFLKNCDNCHQDKCWLDKWRFGKCCWDIFICLRWSPKKNDQYWAVCWNWTNVSKSNDPFIAITTKILLLIGLVRADILLTLIFTQKRNIHVNLNFGCKMLSCDWGLTIVIRTQLLYLYKCSVQYRIASLNIILYCGGLPCLYSI